MADKRTLREISSDLTQLNSVIDMPEIDEDERKEIEEIMEALTIRQANKIDCTIGVLKSFDRYIENFDKEIKLLQEAKRIMQNKKAKRIDTIKDAYQENLCGPKLTGDKYQITMADNSPKVEDNFDYWDSVEIAKYGLEKTTIIRRLSDGQIIDEKKEVYPDKDRLKADLVNKLPEVPKPATLKPVVRLTYKYKTRLS
tara:strand:+ start:291 stop:884 length:594 start_codon:yes stop_codon:yes gene_type:complete